MKGQQPRTIYTTGNLKLYRWHNAKGEQLNVWSANLQNRSQGSGELGREVLSGDAPWLRKTRKTGLFDGFSNWGSQEIDARSMGLNPVVTSTTCKGLVALSLADGVEKAGQIDRHEVVHALSRSGPRW